MASSSSYMLFSQTSLPFGTRDLWRPAELPGGTAGTVPGLIEGAIADFPLSAFDGFAGTEFVRTDWALLDFVAGGQTAPDAPLTGAIDAAAVLADGHAFAGPPGPRNPAIDAFSPGAAVSVVLADRDWNGIKNLEVLLTTRDLIAAPAGPAPNVFVRNVVDVRLKLGDTLFSEGGAPAAAAVVIENAKRGEIDAVELGFLDASVSFASNGAAWGNTFAIQGATGQNRIILRDGDWAGGPTALDGFPDLVTDGGLTRLVATLGGDDLFDASRVMAAIDLRPGEDAGEITAPWEGVPYEVFDFPGEFAGRFDAPTALLDIGVWFAAPTTTPVAGAATLWRDGVALGTIDPGAIEVSRFEDNGTEMLLVAVRWLATESFDTVTIEGLGGLGDPLRQVGGGHRPGWTGFGGTDEPPPASGDGTGDLIVASGGADLFRYAIGTASAQGGVAGDGHDTIWGFERGTDRIVIENPDDVAVRVFDSADGTVVMFGDVVDPGSGTPVQRNAISLVGARDLALGTDIVIA
ncbi:hypothetical protein [Elioraea rosea]|uniref:hypothetical protein n=1 Tax=Elioraea rosea TaxID=2492390 RepID=UPI001181F133|nr:hypothetical protein [Elioraea rosea]